jgi:hypothetical protein
LVSFVKVCLYIDRIHARVWSNGAKEDTVALDDKCSDLGLAAQEDALAQLVRGRKVEASLLLIMCFESASGLAEHCAKEYSGYHHNASVLVRLLQVGYESGSLKYPLHTRNVAEMWQKCGRNVAEM